MRFVKQGNYLRPPPPLILSARHILNLEIWNWESGKVESIFVSETTKMSNRPFKSHVLFSKNLKPAMKLALTCPILTLLMSRLDGAVFQQHGIKLVPRFVLIVWVRRVGISVRTLLITFGSYLWQRTQPTSPVWMLGYKNNHWKPGLNRYKHFHSGLRPTTAFGTQDGVLSPDSFVLSHCTLYRKIWELWALKAQDW